MKIVVFDLDETLGYFVEFGIFWDCLVNYLKNTNNYELTQSDFNQILDLYPEFLRPNIVNILTYLKSKKTSKCCSKMMIYTNNQGPRSWADKIISYFETKLNYKLFDQIVGAFKINGKQIELCRTSHDKSYNDFIKCTKIPDDAEICFLDDNYFPGMNHKNIYYINLKPYVHDLNFSLLLSRFMNNEISNIIDDTTRFEKDMMSDFRKFNFTTNEKNESEYEIDGILGKQILMHLQMFFKKTSYTRRQTTSRRSKTSKRSRT